MYHGKRLQKADKTRRRSGKMGAILVSVLLLLGVTVSGTLAYLTANTDPVKNTFTPSKVTNEIEEKFEDNVKSSIIVKNTGDTEAYVRVKLVTYRVDDYGNHIGGEAKIPAFTLGSDWFEQDGYYYYKLPVAVGASSGDLLASGSSIKLEKYTDADGGKQVIEVIAESIQSKPVETVKDVWEVGVDTSDNLTAK